MGGAVLKTEFLMRAALGAAAAVFLLGSSAKAQEHTLKFANVDAPESIGGAGMRSFKSCVEEKSNDRVAVELHYSGALGNQRDNLESLQAGLLAFTNVVSPITTVEPTLAVFNLPYIFRNREHVDMVMSGAVGDWVDERLQAKGLKALGYWEGGFRHITNNVRPINVPSDLEGIKIRTPNDPIRIKVFNEWGANASALPWAEVYSALQTGVYDAQENPAIYVRDAKFYEVQKYLSMTGHVYGVSYLLASKEIYDNLPSDIRLVLGYCGNESAKVTVDYAKSAEDDIIEFAEENGMEVNSANVDAFVEAAKPLWRSILKDLGKEASVLAEIVSNTGSN